MSESTLQGPPTISDLIGQ